MRWCKCDVGKYISTPAFQTGYPKFSRFLTSDPDRFLMVFRRFDRLAIQNLVYLQSELQSLQDELDSLFHDDFMYNGPNADLRKDCLRCWRTLEEAAQAPAVQTGAIEQGQRLRLIRDIREKMRAYREALLQEAAVTRLDAPSQQTVKSIQANIEIEKTFPVDAESLYMEIDDLVSLKSPVYEDRITSYLEANFPGWFKICDSDNQSTFYYDHEKAVHCATSICGVLAVASLAAPVWGLYAVGRYVKPRYAPWIQLTIMTASTFGFLFTLICLVKINRSELFTAATTYFAVLVIFLGLNLGH